MAEVDEQIIDRGNLLEELSLKTKEHLGERTQKEFDALLGSDFKIALKDNPPIKGGIFDAESELEKIRATTGKEKRRALSIYKANLMKQCSMFEN